ncbi:MAG: shikimate kinase / 3-dehydroquinate synthase, partial [Chloroflexota bacterium]|nr:shikimate kinase / 3-dehydroquinate synthase [Chloroflexota bacterium]
MDVVMVGLPGSGKSVIGRRLAKRHGAAFIDLDERIESGAGRAIEDIFAEDGEAAFRRLERAAIADLGPADPATEVQRVISTGGGSIVDPRNRWGLYRGRTAVWLDGRPEVLAQRLRRSPNVRPLVSGRDPIGTIRDLAAKRERFYAAARIHQFGVGEVRGVVDAVEEALGGVDPAGRGATLMRAETPIGRIVLGDTIAIEALVAELDLVRARRAILVSEPGAWEAAGERLADGLRERGREVVRVLLPQGEAAKRLDVVETAARELAALRVERSEVLVAIGGGALGDAAGFLAAIYLRGIRFIQVPTTLVAQIDSAIGGKTGVDLPEGKNLVGAFHQPSAIVIDVDLLRTLPERQMRAALGEAVKMAVLGDERLLELLETDGQSIARGDPAVFSSGAVAELVERA